VYLVGAGPGDPGLLTVRGAEVLRGADVVVYDRLSIAALLDLAPAQAERINVGKTAGHATMPQPEIDALLVKRGAAGQQVVRLKGGDPFVFARGGEEAQALLEAGVPFEIIPGISSAIAVPAYAGIPLTLRHSSTSFTVVTGHEDPDHDGDLDWDAVARLGGTIVILMGVGRLAGIVDRLVAGGLSPDTPAAAIRWGTRPDQQTVRATLGTLADQPLAAPSTIVIGQVAALNLNWFESRPLFGRRIVVTRARDQASSLVAQLRAHGADTSEVPAIEIREPLDGGAALRRAIQQVGVFDWLVVTSANGATRVLEAVRDARQLAGVKIAAIGPGTVDALKAGNIEADLVPARSIAEGMLDVFPGPPASGGRVLIARAEIARDVIPDGLRDQGWDVEIVDAYRTVATQLTDEQLEKTAAADLVCFTSASTVDHFVDAVGIERVPTMVASIGPVTSTAARSHGLTVDIEATDHSIPGLVAAIVASFV